jgi:hypothetical protein
MVGAVLDGIQAEMAASGTDIGEIEDLPEELTASEDLDIPEEVAETPGNGGDGAGQDAGDPGAPEPVPAPTPSAEGIGVPGPDQPSRSGS